jgi:hypothetical protein
MAFIRNFMWIVGPVSSLFDFLTCYVLLAVLKSSEALFLTGWFVESLATQVLVIFTIRTRRNPLSSRPHAALAATSLAVVIVVLILLFTGLGHYFGFQLPPAEFLGDSGGAGRRLPRHRRSREAHVLPPSGSQAEMSRSVEGLPYVLAPVTGKLRFAGGDEVVVAPERLA